MQKQARDVQRGEEGEDDIPGLKPSPTAFFNHDSGRIKFQAEGVVEYPPWDFKRNRLTK